jgi:stress response protein YsnF
MADDLSTLSDDDLLALAYELQAQKDEIRVQQLAVNAEIDSRAHAAAAAPAAEEDVAIEGVTAEGGAS